MADLALDALPYLGELRAVAVLPAVAQMGEVIITGASRGIGAALARKLGGPGMRLVLLARDAERLDDVRADILARGGDAVVVVGDLSSVAGAHSAAERIGDHVSAGVTLVQNAGVWPSKRRLTPEGLETAFVVNHLAPQVSPRSCWPQDGSAACSSSAPG